MAPHAILRTGSFRGSVVDVGFELRSPVRPFAKGRVPVRPRLLRWGRWPRSVAALRPFPRCAELDVSARCARSQDSCGKLARPRTLNGIRLALCWTRPVVPGLDWSARGAARSPSSANTPLAPGPSGPGPGRTGDRAAAPSCARELPVVLQTSTRIGAPAAHRPLAPGFGGAGAAVAPHHPDDPTGHGRGYGHAHDHTTTTS